MTTSGFAVATAALCAAGLLGACAPDAWKHSPGYDAFLKQVQNACYYKRIGAMNVGELAASSGSTQSMSFVNETSRLYFGKITREVWTSNVTSFIQGRASDPGVQCVLDQLDNAQAAQPGPAPVPPPPSR